MPDAPARILIVDDELDHAQVMVDALDRLGHPTEQAHNITEATAKLDRRQFDVIVTDLMMDGSPEGLELLTYAMKLNPAPVVLLVTAYADIPTCKQALSEGAFDYIEKPLDLEYFRTKVGQAVERSQLRRENEVLTAQVMEAGGFEGIVGRSPQMLAVVQTARQVAMSDIPILILGESGTGKELFARAIHNHSRRRRQRLVPLNCAGLSESILEDELFGHVKGAFTGAQSDREGRFEYADRGTLFLDEIGDMPGPMQAKLLRVLESGEVVRLGSNEVRRVDVRLISATNRNLDEMVAERKFREDLFFRIKGISLHIPPLRERRPDIPLLTLFFMNQSAEKYGKKIDGIEPAAQHQLMAYSWPGNVRQLRNVVENMVVLSDGPTLRPRDLPPEISPRATAGPGQNIDSLVGISIEQAEKELIRNTLKMTDGNREQASKILGIGERTLYRKLKEYDLT
ncbi:MAG TPA: sigma-54 dependent transcriptional regulator [Tepidisphaeraceae bacterium]|jgi:two-component system response regulator HydG